MYLLFAVVSYQTGEICTSLNKQKVEHSLSIIEKTYGDYDIAFLQEVSASFKTHCEGRKISENFEIHSPSNMDSDRDQNSFIMLKKGKYTDIVDETAGAIAEFPADAIVPVVAGDLFVLSAVDRSDGQRWLPTYYHTHTHTHLHSVSNLSHQVPICKLPRRHERARNNTGLNCC